MFTTSTKHAGFSPYLTPDLDVWMVLAGGAPLPGTTLFLAVLVELWVSQDRDSPTTVGQRESGAAVQTLLVRARDGKDHRHRQVNNPTYEQRSDTRHIHQTHRDFEKLTALKGLKGNS